MSIPVHTVPYNRYKKNKYFNSSFSHGFYSYFHRLFLKEKSLPSHLLSTVHVEVKKKVLKMYSKEKRDVLVEFQSFEDIALHIK